MPVLRAICLENSSLEFEAKKMRNLRLPKQPCANKKLF
jgi:hypothetical protein